MTETPPPRSSMGSLLASRRKRREGGEPPPARPEAEGLRLALARTGESTLEGHVADPADPDARFVVELLLDGLAAGLARADLFVPALGPSEAAAGEAVGDGCHGFVFALDPALLPLFGEAAVRLANTGELVGEPIALHEPADFASRVAPAGAVRWSGGLEIDGWIARDAATFPARIEARIDDVAVAHGRADLWRSVERGGVTSAEPGFRLRLPTAFADGRWHEVEVLAGGRPIPGSPLAMIAFADGLAAFLEGRAETDGERAQAAAFDRLRPAGVPFADLAAFEARFPAPVPLLPPGTGIALAVVGEDGTDATLASPALAALPDWIGVSLPGSAGRFDPADLRHFLEDEAAPCGFVVLLPGGTAIRPGGVERLVAALLADSAAAVAFGDVLLATDGDDAAPLALTAFDGERALEQGCGAGVFAMRREAALAALARGAGDLDRLFLAPLEQGLTSHARHWHVPGFGFTVPPAGAGAGERLAGAVRAHLTERGIEAEVEPRAAATLPALRLRRAPPEGTATIVLDLGSHDGPATGEAALEACLEALEGTRARTPMSLIVSAGPMPEAAIRRLALGGIAVASAARGTSPARRLWAAVAGCEGAFVCTLDARLRPLDDDWLAELLGRLADPGTGLVAPVLTDAAGLVAEAGLALELGRPPAPLFAGCGAEDPGHGDMLHVARQVSAVGPACLLTRRADFVALGGFDPVLFPRHFGAADYALKLQALGRRTVVTPDARLAFAQGAARALSPLESAGREREAAHLSARWPHAMAPDRFGHPFLRRGEASFTGLAWPPADGAPRTAALAPPRAVPPGW